MSFSSSSMNSIERGNTDHWTIYPKRVDALKAELAEEGTQMDFANMPGGLGGMPGPIEDYLRLQRRFAHVLKNERQLARIQAIADENIRKFGLVKGDRP